MKKNTIKYGVIDIPAGTILCNIEKGGDKDGKAIYRFTDSGKKTSSRIISLVTNETTMPDLYGATWAHTKNGWVKAEDKITWYSNYKEASNAYASLTNRTRKVIRTILLILLAVGIGYLAYKLIKQRRFNTTVQTHIDIPTDEIPMD